MSDVEFPNAPWNLWRLAEPAVAAEEWERAARQAWHLLEGLPAAGERELRGLVDSILTERQFGDDHWRLGPARWLYYSVARPLMPAALRPALRRLFLAPQRRHALLEWPVEDRYVRFQFETLRHLLAARGVRSARCLNLWPDGARFALALSHDVESARGMAFIREVAALEERYGFRSAINVVAEGYRIDQSLLGELRERGFEIGLHGLKHDGRLFLSRRAFDRHASGINAWLERLGAAGFRAPFTHRNPDWMQSLRMEYDSSFFDTDPFETIPGGTMSIWPFMMGRFVELPMTLAQDHTLVSTLGERTPRLWLEKVAFIERHGGMAMMVTHPDYMVTPEFFSIYEEFLRQMSLRRDYWHALPRDLARWWRARAELPLGAEPIEELLPGACYGAILLRDNAELALSGALEFEK